MATKRKGVTEMANEKAKKQVENEQSVMTVENKAENGQESTALIVERKKFTAKDGREMFGYYVEGEVRGRKVVVDFSAADQGGYEVLDIIFDIKPTAELVIHDEVMINDDGERTTYTVYEVQNIDEDGEIYSYQVKPARKSDKSLLKFMLIEKTKQNAVKE